ncbi:hypothetical protein [uncultured Mitsuokella sp.]|uniref:hypothetical protein n=1 Tax=uncultured Mitsuokella sp. TaxID=453120 RepID=UPI00262050DB|nr:hypothetical protein [uncultured Mitsuokella sp.]
MNNVDRLARMLAKSKRKTDKTQHDDDMYAYSGTWRHGGKVEVNGMTYDAVQGSYDLKLQDGCTVYCIPIRNGEMMIVGGGVN